jgi:hypothetical protein
MQFPQKEKVIEIKGNSYKLSFPNNRGFIAIYSRKAALSKEMYDVLKYGLDANSRYVALLIDAIATLENIMPEQFFKDINLQSIIDGDVIAGAELVTIYRDNIQDWFDQWIEAIGSVLKSKDVQNNAQ